MKIRLVVIIFAVAAFAWGFAALVERSDTTIRVNDPGFACDDWSGEDCNSRLRR